jgi:predicted Zn-dependent protease
MRLFLALLGLCMTAVPLAGQTMAATADRTAAERAFDDGRYREAAAAFRSLTAATPAEPSYWYGLGRSYEALARQAFSELQRVAPGSPWEALVIADVWATAGRHAQALELYRQVRQAAPDIPGVDEAIVALYEHAGETQKAAEHRAALKPPPPTCAPDQPHCEFLSGRYLAAVEAAGRKAEASSLYWRTLAFNALATEAFSALDGLPPSAEVHMVRAAVDRDQGRTLDAIPELKAALALRPGDRAIEEELASALYETRNLEEALPLLARLAGPAATASADLAFFYGDALLQAQQVEQALPYLRAAHARQPDADVVRASLGRALLQSGDAAAALPHLQAAAAASSPDSDGAVHYQLAQAYQRLGRADEARTALAEYQKRQAARDADAGAEAPAPR